MKIKNLNIYGGSQQFATTIINKSEYLSDLDAEFLQLIHDHVPEAADRAALIEQLKTVNDPTQPSTVKEVAANGLKKFVDSVIAESGVQAVGKILERAGEWFTT